jgi:nicotinamide riboside transporter PnuC
MSNFIIAIIRTVVPMIVGWAVALLASINIPLPDDVVVGVTLSIATLAGSLYYIAVAWLARKWKWFGWLLGVARNPVYAPVDLANTH